MKAIIHGNIILPTEIQSDNALLFDKKIIGIVSNEHALSVADEIIDAKGAYVSPGFVDVHIHGYVGADTSDADKEGLIRMANALVETGTTSFLPTTMTIPLDDLEKALDVAIDVQKECKKEEWKGAKIIGVHAEGPFINKAKKGAQLEEAIVRPNADIILRYQDIIKLITMAPETEGGMEFIREICQKSDIQVSIGHTEATYEQAIEAINYGASHITHTFNAMTPLKHRDPGVAGAALTKNVYAELICDTFHVHPGLFDLAVKSKGEHLVLITDCVRAGGMPDGEYSLGGQPIFLKGIECRLADGVIAGSVLKMNEGVKNLYNHASITLCDAIAAASLNPANSINMGHKKGSLLPGKDADIILMDEEFSIKMTIVGGKKVYEQ